MTGAPATVVVLLHGFGGTHRHWDGVIDALDDESLRPVALDLPGHGDAADAPRPLTFAGCVDHVLASSPERFDLCGYSLGGRVALHVALHAPYRVDRLVLVSSTPGISDPAERALRREADHRLARELDEGPFEDFIDRWRTQPLFASDPPQVVSAAREDQRRNRPDALAAVMRGIGTGEMTPLWDRLTELQMPVTIIAGDRDHKFRTIAKRMADLLPHAELLLVPGGHSLALENPDDLASVLDRHG